jgi:hypothetical protein
MRVFERTLRVGGRGAQIIVPGVDEGYALQIERRDAAWTLTGHGAATAHLDGRVLAGVRDLRLGDVISLGEAHIAVEVLTRTLLQLNVHHLVGNNTIVPADAEAVAAVEDDEDLPITAATDGLIAPEEPVPSSIAPSPRTAIALRRGALPVFAALAVVGLVAYAVGFHAVRLDVRPADASVRVADTAVALRRGDTLYLREGVHTLRAERAGYFAARADVVIGGDTATVAHLHLSKLPGRLDIDTGGIAASVSADGVRVGEAPGEVEVPAGWRTVLVHAPRYFDYVDTVDVAGAGARQALHAALRPAWGTLQIAAPGGTRVSVDGSDSGMAPASLELDAGVRHVRLSAPGRKDWESSVVVQAGKTLKVGPITLGQPDAHLIVRSSPPGAEVSIARTFRGRTPLAVDLPAGVEHEIVLTHPGYGGWTRTVSAEPGGRLVLAAQLQPILFNVAIASEPAGAELRVDGELKGNTPQTLQLLAIEHRIELTKAGFVPFITSVAPAATGMDRTLEYRLVATQPTGTLDPIVPAGTRAAGSAPPLSHEAP